MSELEKYFSRYRRNIIGIDAEIETSYGSKKLIYADWIASGRLYMTDDELLYITDAIRQTVDNAEEWQKDYCYDRHTNEFNHCNFPEKSSADYSRWFKLNQ